MADRVTVTVDAGVADVRMSAKELIFTGRIVTGPEAVQANLEKRPPTFVDPA